MKKRNRLALPLDPPTTNDWNSAQPTPAAPSSEIAPSSVLAIEAATSGLNSNLAPQLRLYEEGLNGDWLQLAWMRQRAPVPPEEQLSTTLVLPTVTCSLHDILSTTKTVEQSVIGANVSPDAPIAELAAQIRRWLVHGTATVAWRSCDANLGDCDWVELLSPAPSAARLCDLVRASESMALRRQLWLNPSLLRTLLLHAGKHQDAAVMQRLVDCSHVRQMAPKAFRAFVRDLQLREPDAEDSGIFVEAKLIDAYRKTR
ncbi:hypothetical protein ACHHYP_00611 [Achlya hypogyna]|uniref:Uncharacterized protein n=1 Tax=Achlya hypogyna TaxID=1202772 RepID=A0A1V9ZUC6_ACHHY|nr:hypothetical protein ACHHYP_00611 [Achlya hypogyna]